MNERLRPEDVPEKKIYYEYYEATTKSPKAAVDVAVHLTAPVLTAYG